MIYCQGTLETQLGNVYIDPVINVYYLSYNAESGTYAFPQIVDTNLLPDVISIIEQIEQILIPAPGSNVIDRKQITEIVCVFLQNQYPNCQFFTA